MSLSQAVRAFVPDLEDLDSDRQLTDIMPYSRRARCLLARNKASGALQDGFMNIIGSIDMIDGMEYHHGNAMGIVQRLAETPFISDAGEKMRYQFRHEVIAYLNRMGQFSYFAKSDFVRQRIPVLNKVVPTITKFVRFRLKHSAHRSLDWPKKEDTAHLQQVHAWAMSSFGPFGFQPKSPSSNQDEPGDLMNPKRLWLDSFAQFQMLGGPSEDTLDFSVEREHPKIMSETFALLELLVCAAAC